MQHVAHQCICMQYILELSKQLDVDPRACVSSFFTRYVKVCEQGSSVIVSDYRMDDQDLIPGRGKGFFF
jgi:hypothetical protein